MREVNRARSATIGALVVPIVFKFFARQLKTDVNIEILTDLTVAQWNRQFNWRVGVFQELLVFPVFSQIRECLFVQYFSLIIQDGDEILKTGGVIPVASTPFNCELGFDVNSYQTFTGVGIEFKKTFAAQVGDLGRKIYIDQVATRPFNEASDFCRIV